MSISARTGLFAAAIVLAAGTGSAVGQTVTVDTVQDVVDFGGAQTISDLPGPDGRVSFREAVIAANNTAGPQTIAFAIPTDDWWLVDNMAVLRIELSGPTVTGDQTTIDFTTQTEFTGDTNPDGPEVGIYGVHPNYHGTAAIGIRANDCVVRGLGFVWNRIPVVIGGGQGNRVVACQTPAVRIGDSLGPEAPSFNVIGGTNPEDGNILGNVVISCYANDNIVIGNEIGSVDIVGSQYCVHPERNRIGGPTLAERNFITDTGDLGNEGCPIDAGIEVYWARDTLIEGNCIGVTRDGTARTGSGTSGVDVGDSIDTTIRNNLIAGQRIVGVRNCADVVAGQGILLKAINEDNVGVVIEGNMIGTDATGRHGITTLHGIVVRSISGLFRVRDVRIGGVEPGQSNLIAFTERAGVAVVEPAIDTEISGNSIHSNGMLGIDLAIWNDAFLAGDGVTANDPCDTDVRGGNEQQNFPVLDLAEIVGGTLHVVGSLESRPGRQYRVEFFADSACDPSGHGEGEVFLGSTTVETDQACRAAFDVVLDAPALPGDVITATATDLLVGATSEFSACVEAAGCAVDFNGDGAVNTLDVLAFLNAWNADDHSADFNGDGTLDTRDVLAFLNAWNAGC
ncbi:MAG TPA: GC-type dockerin domain-anchored protein [Phycisphaerales bacterium]|nr:GC-type dockerin domain-anchored protein [Phycisphaerales bacterium]